MEKLNFFGVGPKIGKILLPWLAITIILTIAKKELFALTSNYVAGIQLAGAIVLGIGLLFYFITVRGLLKGLKETRLVTTGGFYFCQNPLYAAIILMIIPSVALLMNSWLILTATPLGYVVCMYYIKKEYSDLEKLFGEAYLKYKSETPEFFPFPIKKIFK